jgi:hypothetical protein
VVLGLHLVFGNFDNILALFLVLGSFGAGLAVVSCEFADAADDSVCVLDGVGEYFVFGLDCEGELDIVVGLVDLVLNNVGEVGGFGVEEGEEGADQQKCNSTAFKHWQLNYYNLSAAIQYCIAPHPNP